MPHRRCLEDRAFAPPGTVSVLAARPAIADLDRRGIDASPALERARLSRELLTPADGRVTRGAVRELWESAALAARDPSFGLHVAEKLAEGAFDLLDYLLVTAETLGAGLAALVRYVRLLEDDAEWQLVAELGEPDEARMVRRVAVPAPQLDELALTWLLIRSRQASGVRWSPLGVAFQHERPDGDRGELQRVFGCPVSFGAAASELRFAASLLPLRHARADEKLFAILARYADAELACLPSAEDLAARVSAAVARQLASGLPDLASTAAAVHLPERTLQRRLAEKGVTHSALVDDVRRSLALQYLAETRLTIGDIAQRLRFSDTTAFHRAFKRWTGAAPSEFRDGSAGHGPPKRR